MSQITLEDSDYYCHELMRLAAGNFYYGMSLLPKPKRSAMFALYAYMRQIDDIADGAVDAGVSVDVARERLELWRRQTHASMMGEAPIHPIFPSLREAVRQFAIPLDLFDAAIDGQLQDLVQKRYETFAALKQYCYRVASTVGIAAVYIWGFRDTRALKLADDRGVALQLTNILRDVREDFSRGRIYLPSDELARFGVDLPRVCRGGGTHAFESLMRFQIERAMEFYRRSEELDQLIQPDARMTLAIMTGIYRGILERIAERPLAVLSGKVSLSSGAKLGEVARQLWRGQMRHIEGES